MGSSGSKKRKGSQHLPKVGTRPNQEYRMKAERKEVFGNVSLILVVAFLVIGLVSLLVITL